MKVKYLLLGALVVAVVIILFIVVNNKSSSDKSVVYDCNFVWPQEIINKDTGKVLLVCPLPRGYCKQGTTQCCEWTQAAGHYNCVDMINSIAVEDKSEGTSLIKTDIVDTEPFVFNSHDSLMIACKNEIDACAVKAKDESGITIKILKMEKFEGTGGNVSGFYDTYKGGTQMSLQSEFSLGYAAYDFPFVLIAVARIGPTGNKLPFVAICTKEGKLVDKGSMFCS